jgi:hypothetical protein
MEENNPKIIPPMEHVGQLVAVDQSRRDDQKSGQHRKKRSAHGKDMEQMLEDQQLHPSRDDGHVDYRA